MLILKMIWNNGIYMCVYIYIYLIWDYFYYFSVTFNVCFCQHSKYIQSNSFDVQSDELYSFKNFHLFFFHINPNLVFRKMYILKRGWNLGFFVTFNITLRHIFTENFIEFPQVVQKIWRNSLSILGNFHQFFGFFEITLLQRN